MFSAVKWVFRWMIWATNIILVMVGFFTFLDWLRKILPYNLNLSLSSVFSLLTPVSLSFLFWSPFVEVLVIFLTAVIYILSTWRRNRTHKTHQRGLELLKSKTPCLLTYDVKPDTSSATHSEEEFSSLLISSNPSDAAMNESQKTKLVETIPAQAAVVVKHLSAELEKEDKFHIRSEAGIPSLPPAGTPPLPLTRPSSYQKKPIVKHTAEFPNHPPLASSLPTKTARVRSSYQKKPTLDCRNKPPSPSSPLVRGRLSGSHEKKPIIRPSVEFPSCPPLASSDKPSLLEFPSHPPPVSSTPAYGHRSPNEKKPVVGATIRTRARLSETTATVGLLRHEPLGLDSWKVVQDDRSYGPTQSYQSDHYCFSHEEQQLFFMDEDLLDKSRDKRPEPFTSRRQEEDEEMEEEKVVMVDEFHPESLEAKWRAITAEARTLKKCETWDVPPEPSREAARQAMKKWETFKDPLPLPMVPAAPLRREKQNERDELRSRADAFIMKFKHDMLLQRQQSAEERYMEMINRGTM